MNQNLVREVELSDDYNEIARRRRNKKIVIMKRHEPGPQRKRAAKRATKVKNKDKKEPYPALVASGKVAGQNDPIHFA